MCRSSRRKEALARGQHRSSKKGGGDPKLRRFHSEPQQNPTSPSNGRFDATRDRHSMKASKQERPSLAPSHHPTTHAQATAMPLRRPSSPNELHHGLRHRPTHLKKHKEDCESCGVEPGARGATVDEIFPAMRHRQRLAATMHDRYTLCGRTRASLLDAGIGRTFHPTNILCSNE